MLLYTVTVWAEDTDILGAYPKSRQDLLITTFLHDESESDIKNSWAAATRVRIDSPVRVTGRCKAVTLIGRVPMMPVWAKYKLFDPLSHI